MKINIVIDISTPIPYLRKLWVISYGPKCSQPIKLKGSLKCNTLRKKWMMNFIFGMQISIEVFYKLILSFWLCITTNQKCPDYLNKVWISSQYLEKNMGYEIHFLPANKYKTFLQINSITFGVHSQTNSKYAKQKVYNIFVISQGKRKGWRWFFACW